MTPCERCGTFATLVQRGRMALCPACIARLRAPLYPYFYTLWVGMLTNPAIAFFLLSRNAAALGDARAEAQFRKGAGIALAALALFIFLPVPGQIFYLGAPLVLMLVRGQRDRLFVASAPRPRLIVPVLAALGMAAAFGLVGVLADLGWSAIASK